MGRAASRKRMWPAIEGKAIGRGAARCPTDLSEAFDDHYRPTCLGDDSGCCQPGEPAPDDDDVSTVVSHTNSTR